VEVFVNNAQVWVTVGSFVGLLVALLTIVPWLLKAQAVALGTKIDAVAAQTNEKIDGLAKTMDAKIDGLAKQMDARFEHVDTRFEQVDARFEHVDTRFEQVDVRFKRMDTRFEQVEARLGRMEGQLAGVVQDVTLLRADVDHLAGTVKPVVEELLRAGVTGRPRAAG
jgi:archaellum component FlaC